MPLTKFKVGIRQYNNKANRLFHRLAIQALVDSRSFREFKIDKRFYWTSGSIAGLNRGASGG